MGQALFWLEAAMASVLFVALGVAVRARIRGTVWRGFLGVCWWVAAHAPWVVVIGALGFIYHALMFDGALGSFVLSLVAGVLFTAGAVIVSRRGRAPLPSEDGTLPPTWRTPRWKRGHDVLMALGMLQLIGWFVWLFLPGGGVWGRVVPLLGGVGCVVAAMLVYERGRKLPTKMPDAPPAKQAWRSEAWKWGCIGVMVLGSLLLVFGFASLVLVFTHHWSDGMFALCSVAGAIFVLLGGVVHIRGRVFLETIDGVARVPVLPAWRASRWKLGYLALAFLGALMLAGMTFWNLELAVRQEMAVLRVESGAIAQSVSSPRLPTSLNAAPLYAQAAGLELRDLLPPWTTESGRRHTAWHDKHTRITEWLEPKKGEFDPDNPEMLEFLRQQEPVFALLRKASRLPGYHSGISYAQPSVDAFMPSMAHIRGLGRLLCLSARVNAHQGNMVAAMEDVSTVLAMADHCADDPTLIAMLVSRAMTQLVFETFQYMSTHGEMTKEGLEAITLNPGRNFHDLVRRSFRMETAFGTYMFTMDDISSVFATWDNKEPSTREVILANFTTPWRVFLWRKDMEAYQQYVRRRDELNAMPFHQAVHELRGMDLLIRWPGGLLTAVIMPSLIKAVEMAVEMDAKHRLMILAVAMWQYRLAEGAFPDELDQLTPNYLLTVPVDPFSGQSMKMTRTEDGGVTITGYVEKPSGDLMMPGELDGYPVTGIGDAAFYECGGLTSVVIPASVTRIGHATFAGCVALTSVTIPDGVTSIDDSAFARCVALTSVTIPESITSISENVFEESGLTSVIIPGGVTSIGYCAFLNCTALTSVTIPDSVTRIGMGAFAGCSSLTSMTIPANVTDIEEDAFPIHKGFILDVTEGSAAEKSAIGSEIFHRFGDN